MGGEGQGLSGLPSGLLLAVQVHQSAAQLGLQDQSKPIWSRASCVILGVGDPSLGQRDGLCMAPCLPTPSSSLTLWSHRVPRSYLSSPSQTERLVTNWGGAPG